MPPWLRHRLCHASVAETPPSPLPCGPQARAIGTTSGRCTSSWPRSTVCSSTPAVSFHRLPQPAKHRALVELSAAVPVVQMPMDASPLWELRSGPLASASSRPRRGGRGWCPPHPRSLRSIWHSLHTHSNESISNHDCACRGQGQTGRAGADNSSRARAEAKQHSTQQQQGADGKAPPSAVVAGTLIGPSGAPQAGTPQNASASITAGYVTNVSPPLTTKCLPNTRLSKSTTVDIAVRDVGRAQLYLPHHQGRRAHGTVPLFSVCPPAADVLSSCSLASLASPSSLAGSLTGGLIEQMRQVPEFKPVPALKM